MIICIREVNQRDFSSHKQPLAAIRILTLFAAKWLGGIAWKIGYLCKTTAGFCLKTFCKKYTFIIKNIYSFCNAVIQKIPRRNPMFSEIFQFFFTDSTLSRIRHERQTIPSYHGFTPLSLACIQIFNQNLMVGDTQIPLTMSVARRKLRFFTHYFRCYSKTAWTAHYSFLPWINRKSYKPCKTESQRIDKGNA